MTDMHIARQMWTRFEPLHDVTYFTPEARAAFEAIGLRGYWRGYFAGRTAPLGAVGPSTVVATYFGFAPAMVERAIPDVWSRATPEDTLRARAQGATDALTRMLADVDTSALDEIAALMDRAIDLLQPGGRVLGAANAALPRDPAAPALTRLWQAATTLREHRGDGHVAALVTYGFDACESVVWRTKPAHREEMQQYRGWTAAEWDAATARLIERGWLDSTGARAAAGKAAYAAIEEATDRAAGHVWQSMGADATTRLRDMLTPLSAAAYATIPTFNPVNIPNPAGVK